MKSLPFLHGTNSSTISYWIIWTMKSNQPTNQGFGGNLSSFSIIMSFVFYFTAVNRKNQINLHIIFFRYLISFKNLLRAIENIGIVSVYGIKYLTTGKVTQENFIKYVEHDTLIWEYLNSSVHLAPYLEDKLQNIYSTTAYQFYRER